jgi:hypothetical protein
MFGRSLSLLCLLGVLTCAEPLSEGVHGGLPVTGTAWTFDAYVPKGYAAHPERTYPTLYLSSPGANPNTKPWHTWADLRGMLVVAINDTQNGQSWEKNDEIQDKTIAASEAVLRIHRVLRYSSGLSGGAWCSVRLAKRHPEQWAGVQMSGHSGNGDIAPKHCAIGMYAGRADKTHDFKIQEAVAELYKNTGNPIRFVPHSGGHIYGDIDDDVSPLVDFCFEQTVLSLPLLTKAERNEQITILKEKLQNIAGLKDPSERKKQCEKMANIPTLVKSPMAGELATVWLSAIQAQAVDASDIKDRHFIFGLALVHPLFAMAGKDAKKFVQDEQRTLLKDKSLKDEDKALQALVKVMAGELAAAGNQAKLTAVNEAYKQIADKLPETKAGAYAAKQAK